MDRRSVKTEIELRVKFDGEAGTLSRILKTLGHQGGSLRAHLVFRQPGDERMTGLFLSEEPTAAALALKKEGFEVTTETVVTVQMERRPRAFNHLVHTLEIEDVRIGYTYAASNSEEVFVVLRTDDNPRAEDILRGYLELSGG